MLGNRSTGICARLVIPITISAMQITMMKYGFRMEKRDTALLLFSLGAGVSHQIHSFRLDRLVGFEAAAIAHHYAVALG